MFYGAVVWDPWLIVAQIVSLQCLYYLSLGVFMEILVGTRVSRMSLVYFFDYSTVAASAATGWCVIASFILGSIAGSALMKATKLVSGIGMKGDLEGWRWRKQLNESYMVKCRAVYMVYLIERAKKCLDFSATLYIIHLLICIMYGGWPSSITWWVVNGTGVAVMALLGEYLCIRRELQEIPISRYRSNV
ncbi:hypothetical protein RHMOL_Rhmol08G0294400 [Rhododendron molle]|uniref:Uncharacterized protein n=1 Tax=Rhododendron molle TaxID=49168 RepID=A0ACC0MTN8_RHOML|nr:hypothetical protein RHMOL_Rhmol08G0294400 [Rhododendron molle]